MYRSFSIKTINEVECFFMYSQFHGEFSDGVLVTAAPFFPVQPEDRPFYQSIIQYVDPQFNALDLPFDFRIAEMEFFCKTFSLFNPNIVDHGSSTQKESSQII